MGRIRKQVVAQAAEIASPKAEVDTDSGAEEVEMEDHDQLTIPQNSWQRQKDDGTLDFFVKPHTVFLLGLALCFLIYLAFFDPQGSTVVNAKRGLSFALLVFLLFAMTHFHNGPFMRPHPAFWRIVVGMNVAYLLVLIFLLFQSLDDAREILRLYDSSLGKPLVDKPYADDCSIYTPNNPHSSFANVMDTVYDEFVLAHILGWFGKAIMYRDFYVTMACSLFFEVLEYTFEHVLPNFRECWWDHLILDVLGCNLIGILAGWWTCRFFAMKNYNWVGFKKIKGVKGKVKRAFLQLTPMDWEKYDWAALHDFGRFFASTFVVFCTGVIDINAFFLKNVLWIPSTNIINTYRLIIWFLFGLQALREYYQFVHDENVNKLGMQAWLAVFTLITEALIWLKFTLAIPGFWKPFPSHIVWGWSVSVGALALWALWRFALPKLRSKKKTL